MRADIDEKLAHASFDLVWRPPLRAYEPPSRPVRLNQRERREAVRYWKQAGVLDERGNVTPEWQCRVGASGVAGDHYASRLR